MSENIINNKRIAKNTIFLYFRMFIIMGVTLYTSRVVLDKLGTDDYGLYNVVGGIVAMLSFLNGTLSAGTSRFLTFELGRNKPKQLHITFNTAFYTHLLLAIIIILIMETGGIWYMHNKLVVAPDRFDAAMVAFQLSLLTTMISITQVPYTSAIMAHEDMGIYAYVSIFEALGKLLVVFLLSVSSFDKLITYTILVTIVQLIVAFYYMYYCSKKYKEAHLSCMFDRHIFKNMLGYTGWNTLANIAETMSKQGTVVVLNLFFAPAVVAAQAISNQVLAQIMNFMSNFRSALNPQIIKRYAVGNYESSRKLTLRTTVYVFDMMLLIGMPLIFLMEPLLNLWLVEVPNYTVVFTRFVVIRSIIATISASLYIPMMASAKLKSNSIASVIFGIGDFFILYLIFKMGGDVMWLQYMLLLENIVFSFVVKPYILTREINYPFKEICVCIFNCIKVAIPSFLTTYSLKIIIHENIGGFIILFFGSIISVLVFSLIFLDKPAKVKLISFARTKFQTR